MFHLPQQGEEKQTKLDHIGGDTSYNNGVTNLQKILQMSIGVLIRLAIERASLHYVDEVGLEFKVHVPNVDVLSGSHICGGGDGELAESLLSHSLRNSGCF